jgi:hypothetical protein
MGSNRSRQRRPSHGGVSMASGDDVRRAIESLPSDLRWDDVRDGLRPVFVRRRPLPPGMDRPITFPTSIGINAALGVDIGPAFLYVGAAMLESWPVTADEAYAIAVTNLRLAVQSERMYELEYGVVGDVPLWWYQSHHGLASGLLLLEDELGRRFGDEARLLIAPMRNLLIAAPFDADRETIELIRDDVASEDPNGLDLPVFALVNGRLTRDRRASSARGSLVH